MDTVYVLLPVHNRRAVTLRFVRCLVEQTYADIRLILIDDGSTDGTAAAVREHCTSVEVIQGTGRWWWAGSLQRGLDRLAQIPARNEDIVLLANDDTTFAPDYVEEAVRFLDQHPCCMLLSRLRNPVTGAVEESGVHADLRAFSFEEPADPSLINCLSTRGLFMRWSDMKVVGGFHPLLLPHYWSDYEFTMRAMRRGTRAASTENVWLEADEGLSGIRDLSGHAGWRYLAELFSTKCLINPIYMSSFVLLTCPPRWIPRNLARIWWQTSLRILRHGALDSVRGSITAALKFVKHRIQNFSKIARVKLQATTSQQIKLVLGSGGIAARGWIATDIAQLNILNDRDWHRYFVPNSIHAIVAEHVWEHLSEDEGIKAARLCFKYLRPGGFLRIAVPDGLHPNPQYIEAVKPGGSGPGAEDHRMLYSYCTLQQLLARAGFDAKALEYFDEVGHFHAAAWDPLDGMIHRSARFDERNRNGDLRYTSIVVDAFKPTT